MEDHDIKDVINRSNKTDIEISLRLIDGSKEQLITQLGQPMGIFIRTEVWANNMGNLITKYLDLSIKGNQQLANLIDYPHIDKNDKLNLYYSNRNSLPSSSGEDIPLEKRFPILSRDDLKLGNFYIFSAFINDGRKVLFEIRTEDNLKSLKFTGSEILEIIE